ncbi:styrene-oxide isomerase StyC [Zavarzinia aquatilis]|uniref:Isomerase n=1 Tax=Zavarzinia aquatilis TaxID=2211142 RepID=A0A317EII3_9PROT|nr:hypothetical protein [Zavarzinia aquatilis]PWR25243.1 hypothetical protein DKG74_05635 [Zavarzinia aquatilis]
MSSSLQARMIGHGALIMLVAFGAGVGLLISLLGGLELIPGSITPIDIFGTTDAWVRAHLGGMLNAILVIVIALALPVLDFGERGARTVGFMLVGTGWANTLFYWAALLSSNRALTFGANRHGDSNWIAWIGLAPALLFTVLIIIAFVIIARRAFARR